MVIYYHYEGGIISCPLRNNEESLEIRILPVKIFGNLHSFLWTLTVFLLRGKYAEYQLWREDKLVCRAEVISWIPIFGFMPKRGFHIGPCRTAPDERGKGYYPYLLRTIVNDKSKDFYMIVDEKNLPSIKGVGKAGFKVFAYGYKNKLGRYIIKERLQTTDE